MRFFRDCGLVTVTVLTLLVLFEIGLRIGGIKYESSLYESDPLLYMTYRPNAQGWEAKEGENFIRINSYGMRDRERRLEAAADTTRIALLGDSVVVGAEVALDRTVGQILEKRLNSDLGSSGHSVEVLNFGVGGYTLAQEYLALRDRVLAFHPQIIILQLSPTSVVSCNRSLYPGNIPYFIVRNGKVIPDPHNRPPKGSTPEARRRHQLIGNLMNRVRLLQLFRKATQEGIPQEMRKLTGAKPAHNDNMMDMWFSPPDSDTKREAWQVAEGLITMMAEESRRQGAEFWITAVGPEIEETRSSEKRQAFLRDHHLNSFRYSEYRLQSIAAAHGIGFISLEPGMLTYSEQHQVSLRGFFNTVSDRGHWNQAGHEAAGEILASALLEDSLNLRHYKPSAGVSTAVRLSNTDQIKQTSSGMPIGQNTSYLHSVVERSQTVSSQVRP